MRRRIATTRGGRVLANPGVVIFGERAVQDLVWGIAARQEKAARNTSYLESVLTRGIA